jgi:hypothetical protein
MAETEKAATPPVSYPHRGQADPSWPVCQTCQGFGHITQERAIALNQAGTPRIKGTVCDTCNGAGRVPDPTWSRCPEQCAAGDTCYVCGGLGAMSPERQRALLAGEILVPGKVDGLVPYTAKSHR